MKHQVLSFCNLLAYMVTHDEIMQAYDDAEIVWKDMVVISGIDVHELLDQAEFAIDIRERLSK